jgi:hypothetical protein
MPDLYFELKEVTTSVNSIALYYKSVMGKMSIEVMLFNDQGKVYVTTQCIIFWGYRLLIYQASATGRCSRAYGDVFTRPYKSIAYILSS